MKTRSLVANSGVPDLFDLFDDCHRQIVAHLDKLAAVVSHLQVAAPDARVRSEARDVAAFFSGPAREHNYDEERHVFPILLACEKPEVKRAAETLCEDHAWIEFRWLDIEPQLAAVAAGMTLSDPESLRAGAAAFAAGMRNHIALEESLLYPELRGRLTPDARRSIAREISVRRAPVGRA